MFLAIAFSHRELKNSQPFLTHALFDQINDQFVKEFSRGRRDLHIQMIRLRQFIRPIQIQMVHEIEKRKMGVHNQLLGLLKNY